MHAEVSAAHARVGEREALEEEARFAGEGRAVEEDQGAHGWHY